MNKRFNFSIFQKLVTAFVIVIIIPLTLSFYYAQKTSGDLVVRQVTSETENSIKLVANTIDSMQQNMYSLAMYVNDDQNIRQLIAQASHDANNKDEMSASTISLRKLERINKFNDIISNISFNMMGIRSYITIATLSGEVYTNWSSESGLSEAFQRRLAVDEFDDEESTGEIWREFEPNYVKSDRNQYPHVLTLGKNIVYVRDKAVQGTILISVTEQSLSELLATEDQLQNRAILDKDFNVISATCKDWIGNEFSSLYNTEFPSRPSGSFIFKESNKQSYIISYETLRDWTIVDVKSYSSVTSQVNAVRNSLLLTNALFMATFIIIAAIIARSISRPMQQLAKMMLEPNANDLAVGQKSGKSVRRDEVGILEENFRIMSENNRLLMQNNIDIERKKRDAELKALQAQISPHFLFNTLNAIRWAAINNHNKKAANMVLALSNLLRMTIVKGDEFITLEEELENLRNYTLLFQMRHSTEFTFVNSITENLKDYKVPKLLLQPLVENAIIHGFENMPSGGIVDVSSEIIDDNVFLRVSDNGSGFMHIDSDTPVFRELKFSGIGITNVDERIKLCFGQKYGISIKDNSPKAGTTIEIILPNRRESDD